MALPVQISFEARVATEPTLRFTSGGKAVLSLRCVVNERVKQSDGSWGDGEPWWVTVSAFDKLAENGAETIEKGDNVVVIGQPNINTWERNGEAKSELQVTARYLGASMRWSAWSKQETAQPVDKAVDDPWGTPQQTEQAPF